MIIFPSSIDVYLYVRMLHIVKKFSRGDMSKKTISLLSVVIVSSLLLAACQSKPAESMTPDSSTAEPTAMMEKESSTPAATEGSDASMTKKGTEISDVETYTSPAGEEQVEFKLTVDSTGMIVGADTVVMGKAPISKVRQEAFKKDFPSVVVGKKLAELEKIDRVGGSSLTTGAFNAAISKLQEQLQ